MPIGRRARARAQELSRRASRRSCERKTRRGAKLVAATLFHQPAGRAMTRQGFFKALKGWTAREPAPFMGQPAHAAPLLRDPSAGRRRRFARGAGDARSQRHFDHPDLYASVEDPSAQGPSHLHPRARALQYPEDVLETKARPSLSNLSEFIVTLSIWAVPTVFAIMLHEVMHGVVANAARRRYREARRAADAQSANARRSVRHRSSCPRYCFFCICRCSATPSRCRSISAA